MVAEAVDEAEKLDLERDLRRTLAALVVAGQAGPLPAAVTTPDEAVEEAAELGDELKVRQGVLNLLSLFTDQQ